MLTLTIPRRYADLNPVIVTSPTTRCGTTLVVRLLSSARNGFVYGEELGQHLRTLASWLVQMMRRLHEIGARSDADLRRALEGQDLGWAPGQLPPAQLTLNACLETFYQIPSALADYGRAIDRPIWGFKCPGYSHDTLLALLTLMPKARIVYVVRNPFDALMSAKARKFVVGDQQVSQFCADWAQNLIEVSGLSSSGQIKFLKYESLIADPRRQLQTLEAFTGMAGCNPRIFDVKVNTFLGDKRQGLSPSRYIEPERLTAAEEKAVFEHAGLIHQELYGRAAAA